MRVRPDAMSLVDLLLNLTALLMWVSWRGISGLEAAGTAGTILGNLRPAERRSAPRLGYLGGLILLLMVRALIYRQVGPALYWHPGWSVNAVGLVFRSDSLLRMLAYSWLSFGWLLLTWYTWMVGILVINRPPRDRDGVTRAIRRQMGWMGGWPAWALAVWPMVMAGLGWALIGWLASESRLMPTLTDGRHLLQQSLVVGLSQVCVLRWAAAVILILHLLNLYVYLGNNPVWEFVQQTGERLSRPFAIFRFGQLDLSPIPALVIYWGAFSVFGWGFPWLRTVMPGLPAWMEYGVFPTLFRSLPMG